MNWSPPPAEGRALVAPSLLAADFADLAGELHAVAAAGADLLHLDVMDGHFVPNLTFGPLVVAAVRRLTVLPLDAHLMISRPDLYLEDFARAGADALTVHTEAEAPVLPTLRRIGELGLRRGISLNPATPVQEIRPLLAEVDLVLVMTVQPGFGGQVFNPSGLHKIASLAAWRAQEGLSFQISVDGGIDDRTGAACRQAGADILVSGSWLLKAGDRRPRIRALRG